MRRSSPLPGFGLSISFTLLYLTLIVLIPLSTLFIMTAKGSFSEIWKAIAAPRTLAAYKITFGLSFIAALISTFFGFIVAWSLTRYHFPGRKIMDAVVDIPFALPTAVAGITLATLYSENGLIGSLLAPLGIEVAFTPLGIAIALIFVGLPFTVRSVQPILQEMDKDQEEAAFCLGATRKETFRRIILPNTLPAILTGFTLAFARGLGEYGSVIFIAGNIPMVSEIVPLLIIIELEEFNYIGAASIGLVMLIASFFLLFLINGLQKWSAKYE